MHKILHYFSKNTFGITNHMVFLDYHYIGFNHIVGVSYIDKKGKEVWLPIVQKKGLAEPDLIGPIWAYLGFRAIGMHIKDHNLEVGLKKYIYFWAHNENIDLQDVEFKIYVKKVDDTEWKWQKDFLSKQLKHPWIEAGTIDWKDSDHIYFEFVKKIESF